MTECVRCGMELTGGVDTFGDIDAPMCWDCHSELMFGQAAELRIRRDELRGRLRELSDEIWLLEKERNITEEVLAHT